MTMEINPARPQGPEQSNTLPLKQLVDPLLGEAANFLEAGEFDLRREIDVTLLSESLREAYDVEVRASSAYIEITPFSCDLFIKLDDADGSYLMYRMDDGITDTTTEASVRHLVLYGDSKNPELVTTKDMQISEFIVFARALDSIKKSDEPRPSHDL